MATIKAFGDWTRLGGVLRKGASAANWQSASDKAILREAHRLRRIMVKAFNQGGPEGVTWPAPKPSTLAMRHLQGKKGTKPMMVTGDLRNSATVVKESEGVFVGFYREVDVGNLSSASLMEIHEFGQSIGIVVTQEVRNFFLAMSIKSKGDIAPLRPDTEILVVEIPPRPVVGPVLDAEKENIGKNVIKDTLKGIGWGEFASLIG